MIVVGAALFRGARVLGARRSAPADLAGRWEFPGGKAEDGESDREALARECREELGVTVTVGPLLGTETVRAGVELRIYAAELIAGEPRPLQDHDELRWLTADQLDTVDWLPADRPVLAAVAQRLRRGVRG